MYKFFINRPIVAMVISIITVIIGLVTLSGLPIAQFPKIIPPEIFIQANYVGADAQTIEQSVATPIEQQMSGVDNMNYMYSVNANNGLMRMYVNFDVKTDANIDHMLTQLRYAQAESQLPADVRNFGVTVQKSLSAPFLFIALFSPNGTRNADGSIVRLKDVARMELATQDYDIIGRLNGKPSAVLALYQLPGSNALEAEKGVKRRMAELKQRFPADLDYVFSLDTTHAVTEGINEIVKTLGAALALVMLVVFVFLQGWRATLIPMLAVPVSLIGTFAVFPLLGFSINTLSLFGLVLAVGLVVDDAIVVVEAVEHHIEEGLSPREATFKAMEEVSGPVMAIAIVLAAVLLPTIFIPGITGRLYQQFAVTIAISVLLSAFNALTLSPALSALLLRPRKKSTGPLGKFFDGFNRVYSRVSEGYVGVCAGLIRKTAFSLAFLVAVAAAAGWFGKKLPGGFLPEEDQGYLFVQVQLPFAASMERTDAVCRHVEQILDKTAGVKYFTTVAGFSLLSGIRNTYSAFFWVTLKDWSERRKPEEQFDAIKAHVNRELSRLPQAMAFAFSPPAIQGVGAAGGFTFILEDRAGKDIEFLDGNLNTFLEAARKRPELAGLSTTFLPVVPQVFVNVDRDKALKQGVDLGEVYKTLQTFMGGSFINYFNRFGRQWQVYVQAEGQFRTKAENLGLFYVRNKNGEPVPLSSLTTV